MTPKAVIFDFDCTLVDLFTDKRNLSLIKNAMYEYYKKYVPLNSYDSYKNEFTYSPFQRAYELVKCSYPEKKANKINKKAEKMISKFEIQIIKKLPLCYGARELIEKLNKKGVKMGIASNNGVKCLRFASKWHHFKIKAVAGRKFPFIPEIEKPDPYYINQVKSQLKTFEDVYYIGDRVTDFMAAKAANCHFIGVKGISSKEEMIEAGAEMVVDNLKELVKFFD